jgi:hypothetical protein
MEGTMPMMMVGLKDVVAPKVFCDWCKKEITEAADGNYEWLPWENGKMTEEPWPIYFTHKGCCEPFEDAHGRGSGALWNAMELDVLPVYLVKNLRIKWDDARKRSRHTM